MLQELPVSVEQSGAAVKALLVALPDERDLEPLVLCLFVGEMTLEMFFCFARMQFQ